MDLLGKIAVVTGASSGIGEATCRVLAYHGMTVVAASRREDLLEQLAASHPRILARPTDVTSDEGVAALARHVAGAHGSCHVLVNNAGARFGKRFLDVADQADVERAMDTNFLGAVRCMAAFADLLAASAPSRVVNVASVAGKIGVGNPGYVASKFALVGFSEAVRQRWAERGVSVCQLNPGFVSTPGFPQDDLQAIPVLGRLVATPDVVAEAILDVARSGARERTVPRWYRSVVVARHVAAPLVWALTGRLRR
jgi:hypothetical protein